MLFETPLAVGPLAEKTSRDLHVVVFFILQCVATVCAKIYSRFPFSLSLWETVHLHATRGENHPVKSTSGSEDLVNHRMLFICKYTMASVLLRASQKTKMQQVSPFPSSHHHTGENFTCQISACHTLLKEEERCQKNWWQIVPMCGRLLMVQSISCSSWKAPYPRINGYRNVNTVCCYLFAHSSLSQGI